MAVLSATVRQQIWRGVMRYWSRQLDVLSGVTKADLQAAVDAADSWVDSNAASYNAALPTTFRQNASAGQKAFLLVAVVLARSDVGLLRSIVGEVD